jgi:shikimate kinase
MLAAGTPTGRRRGVWISLIGFMGSGKSTVARLLGERALLPVVDLDLEIVRREGAGIGELFRSRGEPGFRAAEFAALDALAKDADLVIACGGGLVTTPAAVALMRAAGCVIWLDAPWETLQTRLAAAAAAGDDRPLLAAGDWEAARALDGARRPLYARAADFRVRTDQTAPEVTASRALTRHVAWQRQRAAVGT